MARIGREGPSSADLSRFPLIVLRTPTVAEYEEVSIPSYFACVDEILAQGKPFAVLHDAREIPPVDDAKRNHFMALLDERRELIEARLVAYAALVGSPLERGIVTAFAWFARLPMPVRLFAREAEATSWLKHRLQAAGLAPLSGVIEAR